MPDVRGFGVPRDGHSYVSQIFETVDQLVRTDIWAGVDRDRLKIWRKNFETDEEQYFAACCLDRLLYRSYEQTMALMRHLWTRKLPMLQYSLGDSSGRAWLELLREPNDARIRVVPIVDESHVTKSGYVIGRYLEKKFRVRSRYIKSPSTFADDDPRIAIFIDDFLGSGTQFERYVVRNLKLDSNPALQVVYAPLVAHDYGVKRLNERFPLLQIVSAETLDDSHRILMPAADVFADGMNTATAAAVFYGDMLKRRGIKPMSPIGGAPHLGVMYAFEHAVPNNSMEILWAPANATGWTPLFDR